MADDLRKIFKENLQFYMNDQGKTQADMARHFNMSTATGGHYIPCHFLTNADFMRNCVFIL